MIGTLRQTQASIASLSTGNHSMFDPIDFDPALVSSWPVAPRLPDARAAAVAAAAAQTILLETKAAEKPLPEKPLPEKPSPAEAAQDLLNQMTEEMRWQFEAFRTIRVEAEALLGASVDDAAIKLAKADIKSATDALSLIVRTLEKIDALQRSLADDRDRAAAQTFDQAAYDALLAGIERKIDARARERAEQLFADWRAAACRSGADGAGQGTGPPGPA
jgi:hypothetical protein